MQEHDRSSAEREQLDEDQVAATRQSSQRGL
jgi:hypothetical protein